MKKGILRALIHVDILVDFIFGTLPVPGGEEIIDSANELTRDALRKRDFVIFLVDSHDEKNVTHFKKWPIHCIRGTEGQKFHPRLFIPEGAFIVFKGTGLDDDGYSGFDEKNVEIYVVRNGNLVRLVRISTLEELLDNLSVGNNDIDGLATEYCDKATALDSVHLGYKTRLIVDACRAVNLKPTDEAEALEEMRRAGVVFTTTGQVLRKYQPS